MACRDMAPTFELLEAVGERLARKVRARSRHLHECELEREAWVAALAHVLDRHREQIDQTDHRRLAELIRLRPEPLASLVRDGQRIRDLAHMLNEHQMPQVLE